MFAPTDDALGILPTGTINALLAEPGDMLSQILLYHSIPGKNDGFQSGEDGLASLRPGKQAEGDGGGINGQGNGVKIISIDIETSNGVIHAIDSGLIPPSVCYETISTSPEAPAHMHRWCEGAEATLEFCNVRGGFIHTPSRRRHISRSREVSVLTLVH